MLEQCTSPNKVRAALQELPTGFKAIYRLTFERIRKQKPEKARLGMTALRWVYFAKRRLTVRELCHAASFEPSMNEFSRHDLVDAVRRAELLPI